MRLFSNYRGLPSGMYILFSAVMINRLGSFVMPFITMILTKKLGIREDLAGFYVMLVAVAGLPALLMGGALADRFGRKKVIVLSQFLSACCLVPCAFFGNSTWIPWLLVFTVFFSEASQPAYSAMVTDLTGKGNRKEAFSLFYLGINIGYSAGPIIAGFLFNRYFKWVFLGDAFTTFASILLIMMFAKETVPSRESSAGPAVADAEDERAESGNIVAVLLKRPFVLWFMLISIIYAFAYCQYDFSLPIYANKVFGDSGPQVYAMIATVNALVVIYLNTIVITATRNLKPIFNVVISGILYAVGFGMLFFIQSFGLFLVSTLVWSVGEILMSVNSSVYIADHSPVTHRGRFNSVRPFTRTIGIASGPFLMGLWMNRYGVRMVWPVIFVLAAGAAALMYVLYLLEIKANGKGEPECVTSLQKGSVN